MPGELDFIQWVRQQPTAGGAILIPPGDDLAALRWDGADLLLVGVDQVLDGVHFRSEIHSPRDIGRKAMNRNLSDCAAMACLPVAAVVSAALPRGAGADYARELYRGMREAGDPFSCAIVGGDTGSWDGKLAISVSILGRSAGIAPVRRSGAQAGDGIYVTGPLGGSIRGRHMTFQPRVTLARQLASSARLTAMIDLSDGLARDLDHLCRESGVGARVEVEAIPVHEDVGLLDDLPSPPGEGEEKPPTADDRAHRVLPPLPVLRGRVGVRATPTPADRIPLRHALYDGEDYELLFTSASPIDEPGVVRIGTIRAAAGIELIDRDGSAWPLTPGGWEHSL